MPRVMERQEFDQPTRLTLLEGDMDKADERANAIKDELKAIREDIGGKFDRLLWAVVGLIIAVSTGVLGAAVTYGLNNIGG